MRAQPSGCSARREDEIRVHLLNHSDRSPYFNRNFYKSPYHSKGYNLALCIVRILNTIDVKKNVYECLQLSGRVTADSMTERWIAAPMVRCSINIQLELTAGTSYVFCAFREHPRLLVYPYISTSKLISISMVDTTYIDIHIDIDTHFEIDSHIDIDILF